MTEAAAEIKAACLRWLAMREHSKKELLHKLTMKGFDNDASRTVLDKLAADDLQNDRRYAESYARSRILKGYGPLMIVFELRQNGIGNDDTSAIDLNELAASVCDGWMALMERIYRKKYAPDVRVDRNEWARRSRYLQQRGFSGAMIADLFEHLNIQLS